MTQTVIHDFPPLYDEIAAAFNLRRGSGVIFSFGARVYAPDGGTVPPEIMAHEAVHGARQGREPLEWWRRYIAEPRFRLAEEVPAHQAEYRYLLEHGNRARRRAALRHVAERLASPLYGRIVGRSAAEAMLRGAA